MSRRVRTYVVHVHFEIDTFSMKEAQEEVEHYINPEVHRYSNMYIQCRKTGSAIRKDGGTKKWKRDR